MRRDIFWHPQDQNSVQKTENRLRDTLQGPVNKALDGTLNSVEFKSHLLQKTDEATTSCPRVKKLTVDMLCNQYLIAPVARIVKKETKRAVHVTSEKEDRRQNSSRPPTVLAHDHRCQATGLWRISLMNGLKRKRTPNYQKNKPRTYCHWMMWRLESN